MKLGIFLLKLITDDNEEIHFTCWFVCANIFTGMLARVVLTCSTQFVASSYIIMNQKIVTRNLFRIAR